MFQKIFKKDDQYYARLATSKGIDTIHLPLRERQCWDMILTNENAQSLIQKSVADINCSMQFDLQLSARQFYFLHHKIAQDTTWLLPNYTQYWETILPTLKTHALWHENGDLIGLCHSTSPVEEKYNAFYIEYFAISSEYQNQGYGKILLMNMIKYGVSQYPENDIALDTTTIDLNQNNQTALSFYEKHGFKVIGDQYSLTKMDTQPYYAARRKIVEVNFKKIFQPEF